MSGIFKGDSIYKSGGAGGGYKDGGALVDGDFIRVENNTISTYENTTRSEINFYVEVSQGDTLNTIIELTNNYNATVFFWIMNPETGILTPIGNIGGDTVTAGEEYNVQATGNSYTVEEVTPPNTDEIAVDLGGDMGFYEFIKIGNLYVGKKDLKIVLPGIDSKVINTKRWYKRIDILNNTPTFGAGARIPSYNDIDSIFNYLNPNAGQKMKSIANWNNSNPSTKGTNESGLDMGGFGFVQGSSNYDIGVYGFWGCSSEAGSTDSLRLDDTSKTGAHGYLGGTDTYWLLRLVKDA